jgi:hypothetical protein
VDGITKDVVVDETLRSFEELLWEWTSIIERMVRGWRSEAHVPWWYNERASLSPFAGAIWRTGGVAFEEFSAKRKTRTPNARGDTVRRRGRVDLQFSYRGTDFIAEAKQAWPKIGRRSRSSVGEVNAALLQASQRANTVSQGWGKKLAIAFAAPRFPKSELDCERQLLQNWRDIIRGVKCDGNAFLWLHDCHQIEDEGDVYPGGGIFIRRITDRSSG